MRMQFNEWRNRKDFSTLIMGILNVTPDSFSDGGEFNSVPLAVAHALQMEKDGADIIDIGGESTRPGAVSVSLQEELDRVISVITDIRTLSDVMISVDTTKADVAREAIVAGASLVNDISGMTADTTMASVVKDFDVPVVIMHIKGTPKDMQDNPHYHNLMMEINAYFLERISFAKRSGINDNQIILDPGIGFGKTVEDNFTIIKELNTITGLGYPVLVGPSRKSFIGQTLNLPENERVEGTAAAVVASVINGARIVRVHDVKEMWRVVKIADKLR
ncbi:MAG: dihydropteroate synthase [Candidatus Marinimicrobia bacterium]|nr:dihydropteroate synthase [Candidatus Neomarinimicrobiota bacterium]